MKNLDWGLLWKVFTVVFISEMGDKTQITTLLLAGAKPLYVVYVALGSATALIATSFIETIIGSTIIARILKPNIIKTISAVAFVILGFLLLTGQIGNISLNT